MSNHYSLTVLINEVSEVRKKIELSATGVKNVGKYVLAAEKLTEAMKILHRNGAYE